MSPNHSFQVIVSSRSRRTGIIPEQNSFAGVFQKNIIISTIKKCDDDDNIIIQPLPSYGKDIRLHIGHHTIETIKIK